MVENEIKLVRLEGFSFDLDGEKLQDGAFSWSGNYLIKLKVSAEDRKIYCNLYYANKDYRIERKKKKKKKEENKVGEIVEELINAKKTEETQ